MDHVWMEMVKVNDVRERMVKNAIYEREKIINNDHSVVPTHPFIPMIPGTERR